MAEKSRERYDVVLYQNVEAPIHILLGEPDAKNWLKRYEQQIALATMISLVPKAAYPHLRTVTVHVPEGAAFSFFIRTVGILNCGRKDRCETRTYNIGYTRGEEFTGATVDEDGCLFLTSAALS